MCGIAGIVSNYERDLGPLLEEMLRAQRHRGPDGAGIVIGGEVERKASLDEINWRHRRGKVGLGHVRLAITGSAAGIQPFQSSDGRLSLLHNGEIYNHRELTSALPGGAHLKTGSDSEVLCRLLESAYEGDLVKAVESVLPMLDGVYATAITDQKTTILVRDPIGVRQLYYSNYRDLTAFASEKKSIQKLLSEGPTIHRLLPGHMLILRDGRRELRRFFDPGAAPRETIENMEEAIQAYSLALIDAVRKRVHDRDRVGIIYSGGIDSFLIALIVKNLEIPFTCYVAGRDSGSTDVDWAIRTAEENGFPLKIRNLSKAEIDELIPEVIRTIEDHSLNQVEVAIPVFAAMRMAQEAGERVILTGQGADELFGGYPWYSAIVDKEGYDEFVERSREDTFLLYKECLEREDKIAMAHSMELRVPYLDPEVIRLAFMISPRLKIREGKDEMRKRIHRQLGLVLGAPKPVAFRSKEAAQHGANVHDVFEELTTDKGLTADLMSEAGYDQDNSVVEKLGSSSRYGYRYGEVKLWKPLPHVQYYLDGKAAEVGMLHGIPKRHYFATSKRLGALSRESGG